MTLPAHLIAGGTRYNLQGTTPEPQRQFFRVKHWYEIGVTMTNRPEVIAFDGNQCDFGSGWQWASYWMNLASINPLVDYDITKKKWTVVHDHMRAFHNGAGFLDSGDPRHNYVTNESTGAPNPKWDKTRTCGGAIVAGTESYSLLQTIKDVGTLAKRMITAPRSLVGNLKTSFQALTQNNILTLEVSNGQGPAPSQSEMTEFLKKFWLYFDAVNVGGSTTSLGRFPQGTSGSRVFVPLVSAKTVTYPLSKLEKLPLGFGYDDWLNYNPYK